MSVQASSIQIVAQEGLVPVSDCDLLAFTEQPASIPFQAPLPPASAEVVTITLAIAAVLAFAAAAILAANAAKQKRTKSTRDDTRQTITTRGEWIAAQMGKYRAAPLFAWVGEPNDRRFRPPRAADKHNQARPAEYRDRGVHVLSVGPGESFTHIMDGERVFWSGNLNRSNFPSGGTINTRNSSNFRLYWGDIEQPVDPVLRDRVGVESHWPGIFYLVWDRISLGETAQWPLLEYVFSVTPPSNVFPEFPWSITASDGRVGWNPAYMIHRLLTGPRGVGAEIPPRRIDRASLVEMGERCLAEGLAGEMRWEAGRRVDEAIGDILTDIGYAAVDGPLLSFQPLRDDQPVFEFSEDALKGPAPERSSDNLGRRPRNLIYEMTSADIGWRTQDIAAPNDGVADESSGTETRPQIELTTNPKVGSIIVERRSRQELSNADTERLKVGLDAVRLRPGDKYRFPGERQRIVSGITPSPSGLTAEVEGPLDVFALRSAEVVDIDVMTSPEGLPVAQDLAVLVRKGTSPDLPNIVYIEVYRARAHAGISAARVHVTREGSSAFYDIGSQDNWAAAGTLDKSLDVLPHWTCGTSYGDLPGAIIAGHNGTQVDTGLNARQVRVVPEPDDPNAPPPSSAPCDAPPTVFPDIPDARVTDGDYIWEMVTPAGVFFEPINDDQPWINQAIDDTGWYQGRQVAVIGEELFYVRSVDPQPIRQFPAGTVVPAGEGFEPVGSVTEFRYVTQNAGTLGSPPAVYPTTIGEQFSSGDVVLETRRRAWELRGLVRAREGTSRIAHPAGSQVFVIPRQNLTVLRDITIRAGDSLVVKTQPATFAETAPLGGATAYPVEL